MLLVNIYTTWYGFFYRTQRKTKIALLSYSKEVQQNHLETEPYFEGKPW